MSDSRRERRRSATEKRSPEKLGEDCQPGKADVHRAGNIRGE
jgi:hypothetical protein